MTSHAGDSSTRALGDSAAKSTLPIIAMVLFYVLSIAVYGVLPLLVGATVDLLGFTARQAGFIGGADMLGATVSALLVSLIVPRGHWRLLIICGIAVVTLADVLSGLTRQFPALLLMRILAGLGAGVVLTIATVSIAETRHPDRVYGFGQAGIVAYGSPALYLMPSMLSAFGLRGVFWLLAVLTTFTAPLIRYMPDRPRLPEPSKTLTSAMRIPARSVIGLAAVLTYFMAQGAVWAYLDRVGMAHRLAPSSVGIALSLSAIAGLLGALLASWMDVRHGRLQPLIFAAVGTAIALLVLNESATLAAFVAMTALFNFCWNVSVPYQFGVLAEIDPSRRTVALAGVVANAGLAAGPMVAAALLSERSVPNVSWIGISFTALSLALFARILMVRAGVIRIA